MAMLSSRGTVRQVRVHYSTPRPGIIDEEASEEPIEASAPQGWSQRMKQNPPTALARFTMHVSR